MSEIVFRHNESFDLDFVRLTCSKWYFADSNGSKIHVHLKSARWPLPFKWRKPILPPCAIFAPIAMVLLSPLKRKRKRHYRQIRRMHKRNKKPARMKNNWIMPQMVSKICASVSSAISHHSYHPEINLFQRSLYLVFAWKLFRPMGDGLDHINCTRYTFTTFSKLVMWAGKINIWVRTS